MARPKNRTQHRIRENKVQHAGVTIAMAALAVFIFAIGAVILLLPTPVFAAWTEPDLNPPQGNVAAPLNVSVNPQTKAGPLKVDVSGTADMEYGVFGEASANTATDSIKAGVKGQGGLTSTSSSTSAGVYGVAAPDPGGTGLQVGLLGVAGSNQPTSVGVYGWQGVSNDNAYAGYFRGKVGVTELCFGGDCRSSWPDVSGASIFTSTTDPKTIYPATGFRDYSFAIGGTSSANAAFFFQVTPDGNNPPIGTMYSSGSLVLGEPSGGTIGDGLCTNGEACSSPDCRGKQASSCLAGEVCTSITPFECKDITAPTVPQNLYVVSTASTEISLQWNPSTDTGDATDFPGTEAAGGYLLYRCKEGVSCPVAQDGAHRITNIDSPLKATAWTDTGLTTNSKYYYAVSAIDAKGNPNNESGISVSTLASTIQDAQPPSAPGDPSFSDVTETGMKVSWTASTDQGGSGLSLYRLFRCTGACSPDLNDTAVVTVAGTEANPSYTDSGLVRNTEYSYRAVASDGAGNTTPSAGYTTQRTLADASPPTPPTALTFTGTESYQVLDVAWDGMTDADGLADITHYTLFRCTGSGCTAPTKQYDNLTSPNYRDTGLSGNTLYGYAVTAYDAAGNASARSEWFSVRTGTKEDPNLIFTGASTPNGSLASAVTQPLIGGIRPLARLLSVPVAQAAKTRLAAAAIQEVKAASTDPQIRLTINNGGLTLAPSAALSVAPRGTMYFNDAANKFQCTVDGTSWTDCGGGSGGGGGTGTANTIPKFTDATTLGNSVIAESGGNVIIGTTSAATLLVNGVVSTTQIGNGGPQENYRVGNDVSLYDVNLGNTLGLYGSLDPTVASIQLGSGGGTISGKNNNVGINTTDPNRKLTIKGDDATLGLVSAGGDYQWDFVNNPDWKPGSFHIWERKEPSGARFSILSGGNVGIGTMSPGALLDVSSADVPVLRVVDTGGAGPQIRLQTGGNIYYIIGNGGGGTGGGIRFVQQDVTGSAIVFTGDGDVGIGTTDPGTAYKLDVNGKVNSASGYCIAGLCADSWSNLILNTNATQFSFPQTGGFSVAGSGNINTDLTVSGKIGIQGLSSKYSYFQGTNAQTGDITYTLPATEPADNEVLAATTGGANAVLDWIPPSGGIGIDIGSGTLNKLAKFKNATTLQDSAVFESGGNVGIGTDDPGMKLDVAGDIRLRDGARSLLFNNGSVQTGITQASGAIAALYTDANVGIGTATPGAKLQISDNKAFSVSVDQGDDATTRYYKLGTFTQNNGEFNIRGIVAGHTQAQGRVNADVTFAARDGFTAMGTALGTFGNSDVVVYYNSTDTYTVYLKTGAWSLANIDLTTVSGGAITYDGLYITSSPSGSLAYTLSTDVGGVVRMTSDGNVGIGTASPGQKLEVQGNIKLGADNSENYLYHVKDSVGTILRTTRSDATQEGLFRTNGWGDFTFSRSLGVGYDLSGSGYGAGNLLVSGDVGIGTTAPLGKLVVNNNAVGTGSVGDAIAAYANSGNATLYAEQDGSGYAGYFSGTTIIASRGFDKVLQYYNGLWRTLDTAEAATTGGAPIEPWIGNSSTFDNYLYLGSLNPFDTITTQIARPTGGSNIGVAAEYSNGSGGWLALAPLTDSTKVGTTSFSKDGALSFTLPSNWGQQSVTCPSGCDTVNRYWVRLKPTADITNRATVNALTPERDATRAVVRSESGDTTPALFTGSYQRVGIATSTPAEALDVVGGIRAGGTSAEIQNYLNGGVGASDIRAVVGNSTASYPQAGVLIVDDEVLSYQGRTDAVGGYSFNNLTRGIYGTTASAHSNSAKVDNYLFTLLYKTNTNVSIPRFTVTSAGNVGINAVIPKVPLTVFTSSSPFAGITNTTEVWDVTNAAPGKNAIAAYKGKNATTVNGSALYGELVTGSSCSGTGTCASVYGSDSIGAANSYAGYFSGKVAIRASSGQLKKNVLQTDVNQANDIMYTLPTSAPAGMYLRTKDANGALEWVNVTGGSGIPQVGDCTNTGAGGCFSDTNTTGTKLTFDTTGTLTANGTNRSLHFQIGGVDKLTIAESGDATFTNNAIVSQNLTVTGNNIYTATNASDQTLTISNPGTANAKLNVEGLGTGALYTSSNVITPETYLNPVRGGTGLDLSTASNQGGALYKTVSGIGVITTVGGDAGKCLISGGTGAPTWGACGGGGSTAWSSLTAPTANLALTLGAFTSTFTSTATTITGWTYNANSTTTASAQQINTNGLTTGSALTLSSTSTAGASSSNSKMLNIARSGTNMNISHIAYGLYSTVTNTGTSSANVAGYFSASGAVNNYGLLVPSGNVGIGQTAPNAPLTINDGRADQGNLEDTVDIYSNTSRSALYVEQQGGGYAAYYAGRTSSTYDIDRPTLTRNTIIHEYNAAGNADTTSGDLWVRGLSVNNSTHYDGGARTLTNIGAYISVGKDSLTNTQTYALITKGGNVGIGTETPAQTLSVLGTLGILKFGSSVSTIFQASASQSSDVTYTLPPAQGAANTVLTNTGSGTLSWANANTSITGTANYVSKFASSGIGLVASSIFDNGSVGIGQTAPSAKFVVNNPTTPTKYGLPTDAVYAFANNSTGAAISGEQGNPSGYAGYFSGKVAVNGNFSVGSNTANNEWFANVFAVAGATADPVIGECPEGYDFYDHNGDGLLDNGECRKTVLSGQSNGNIVTWGALSTASKTINNAGYTMTAADSKIMISHTTSGGVYAVVLPDVVGSLGKELTICKDNVTGDGVSHVRIQGEVMIDGYLYLYLNDELGTVSKYSCAVLTAFGGAGNRTGTIWVTTSIIGDIDLTNIRRYGD